MFLFYFCSWGMWDLSSPTRDRTHTICIGRWSLNHWTTSEVSYQYRFWGCSFCRQTLMITWNQLYTSDKPIWNPSSYYFQSFTHHPRPLLSWVLHAVLWHRVSVGTQVPKPPFIWKTQQWPQDWKRSVFIPIPRKKMPKNAQTIAQLHSSHMLVK